MQIVTGWVPTSEESRIDPNVLLRFPVISERYCATSLMTHCNFHDIVFSIGTPVAVVSPTSDINFQYLHMCCRTAQ